MPPPRLVPLLALVMTAPGCTRHRADPAPARRAAPAAAKRAAPAPTEPAAPVPAKRAFDPHAILRWPQMRADRFGCMLQRRFGHRDETYNCDLKNYRPGGDPCHDTHRYYAGPTFPRSALASVDPRLQGITLHWEHGALQAATLTFRGRVPVDELVHRFGLPKLERTPGDMVLAEADYPKGHDNVSRLSIERCGKDATCLDLEGFDHQGAGDVDCGPHGGGGGR